MGSSAFETRIIDGGLVSAADLERARSLAETSGRRLSATLVRLGMIAEVDLAPILSETTGTPLLGRAALAQARPDGLNVRFLRKAAIVPVTTEAGFLLAMGDPADDEAATAAAFALGTSALPRTTASFSDIIEAIGADPDEVLDVAAVSHGVEDLARMAEGESDAPVIRLVQRLLTEAVDRRASDVHIEPMARRVAVRFRIDGRLIEIEEHPVALAEPIASRVKVIAALDIAETRLPQDGRLRITVRGRDVDVRVSTSPIAHGESIVMRILGRAEVPLDLEKLGLPPHVLARLHAVLDRPHGIILLTGPTGSGKTTTLYAAINRLRRPDVKILTVEDPVEVLLDGINQVQVRPEIELSYAATLRAFLRQDPDILMIGEIRDAETAEIAMRAALTGHLVLSTLHTNSATGAFTRLTDIGIEPYLTASTVIAAIAQRLVRVLCGECASAVPLAPVHRALFARHGVETPDTVCEAVGCVRCGGSGYRGRAPIIEIFELDDAARDAVRRDAIEDLVQSADHTLLAHGLALVAEGRTSIAEVQRVVDIA